MADPIGIAVAGVGNAGLEHLRAFRDEGGSEVRAIVDADLERAAGVRSELGLECELLETVEPALARADVDALVVATPNDTHCALAVAAAGAGKHVLLEKPAALSVVELDAIGAAIERTGVHCEVNMILRWHPMIVAIRSAIEDGSLGDVFCVEADFVFGELEGREPDWARTVTRGGNVHLYAGCHAYDQLQWLAGDRAVAVSSFSTRRSPEWEYDVTAVTAVRFAGGAVGRATITLEAASPYRFGVRVFGTRATIVDNTMIVPDGEGGATSRELCPERVDVTYLPFERVAASFLETVAGEGPGHASFAATRDLFELALDAERSALTGGTVSR